jgi:hypothetical protein
VMTRASARGPVDDDRRCPHSSSFVGRGADVYRTSMTVARPAWRS